MKPYTLHQGDALETLRTMPDESVQTCVTSPPYFGLRDYGTAEWQGGDAECDHKQTTARQDGGRVRVDGFNGSATANSDKGAMNYRDICGKCGAKRIDSQIGLEETPDAYVERLVEVFREVKRVLKHDATLWLNLGDSYGAGKQLMMIPARVALALQADGWILRSDIIWGKLNPLPESVTDRPTKAHEYIFLLSKNERYFYDHEAIKEPNAEPKGSGGWQSAVRNGTPERYQGRYPSTKTEGASGGSKISLGVNVRTGGRNKRTVWAVATRAFPSAHFATFPPDLIRPCILAGAPEGGVVLDPFSGAATTGLVALQHRRRYIGIELNPEYIELSRRRLEPIAAQPSIFAESFPRETEVAV